MNDDASLDDSAPTCVKHPSRSNGAGTQLVAENFCYELDATRPRWDHVNPSVTSTSVDAGNANDAECGSQNWPSSVGGVANSQSSQPLNYFQLVLLWRTVIKEYGSVPWFYTEGLVSLGSTALGRGLSFNVHLSPVSEQAERTLQLRSRFVVLKSLRGLTDKLDGIEKGQLLRAVLLEVRVLSHKPLKKHPNIIRLLSLFWEQDPDTIDQAWPVIALEYAENGTLADFQIDYPDLPYSRKKKICLDVGSGLAAIHASNVIHGDLKSENVLICNTDDGSGVIAKLADFGCAVTDLEPQMTVKLRAFTAPWNAPESHDCLLPELLKYTDVYSYGLLVWRVALDGVNPFRCIDGLTMLPTTDFHREVEKLKFQDDLLEAARQTLRQPFCNPDVDTGVITNVLQLTLCLESAKRNLNAALASISPAGTAPNYALEPLKACREDHLDENALAPATLIPVHLELSIVRELEALSRMAGSVGRTASLQLFAFYMQRLDRPDAREEAEKWYLQYIQAMPGTHIKAFAWDIFEILQRPIPPTLEPLNTTKDLAANGCYHSLMTLRRRSPLHFQDLLEKQRRRGGWFLYHDENGTISNLANFVDFEAYFNYMLAIPRDHGPQLIDLAVSKNRDLLIHAAARCGCVAAIDKLLSLGADIDSVNNNGESAFFQACQAGHLQVAQLLVSRGASTGLAANNGETALHWVWTFDDANVEQIIELIVDSCGQACLFAGVPQGRSVLGKSVSLYGTPLHYAIVVRNEVTIQALLQAGADPFIDYQFEKLDELSTYTPFRLAIIHGLPGTVKTIMDWAPSRFDFKSYLAFKSDNLLHFALIETTAILQRAKLGLKLAGVLIEMLDLLQCIEDKDNIYPTGRGIKLSLLHACIIYSAPIEVIRHLLQTSCTQDIELVGSSRNHTPLQAAMHLNRREVFLLLLEHGADIHRTLQFPQGLSYLQYCAFLGSRAIFFAGELVSRGVTSPAWPANGDGVEPARLPPRLLATVTGNLELATFLAKECGDIKLVPSLFNVLLFMFRSMPRLPVSRIRYLMEPPHGLEPLPIIYTTGYQETCFHTLARSARFNELELLVNFRYLLQKSKAHGAHDLLNQLNAFGLSPLHFAIIPGHLELVREMLASGADPNAGAVPTINWAHSYLKRLQKAPTQFFAAWGGRVLSRREARWLQDDFKSIISLLKQYGGQEHLGAKGQITSIDVLSLAKNGFLYTAKESADRFQQVYSQKGFWSALGHIWQPDSANRGGSGVRKMSSDVVRLMTKSVQNSHQRFTKDSAVRSRFSSDDGKVSASICDDSANNGLLGKIDHMLKFAYWYANPPAKEIEQKNPLASRRANHLQGAHPTGPEPAPAPATQAYAITGIPSSSDVPVSWDSQGRQPLNSQTPQAHIQNISQQLSYILSLPPSETTHMLPLVQESIAAHFARAGAGALSQYNDVASGAPLGSLSVLELETGLNKLFNGHFKIVIMKRDGFLNTVVGQARGETCAEMVEQIQGLVDKGWLTWQGLEEKEAQILSRSF